MVQFCARIHDINVKIFESSAWSFQLTVKDPGCLRRLACKFVHTCRLWIRFFWNMRWIEVISGGGEG